MTSCFASLPSPTWFKYNVLLILTEAAYVIFLSEYGQTHEKTTVLAAESREKEPGTWLYTKYKFGFPKPLRPPCASLPKPWKGFMDIGTLAKYLKGYGILLQKFKVFEGYCDLRHSEFVCSLGNICQFIYL